MTNPKIPSRTAHRWRAALLATLTGTAVCLAATPAGASGRPAVAARGQWSDTEPLTITSVQGLGAGAIVTATGSSVWSGTLSGTTHFVLHAIIDPSGSVEGSVEETFDGTVAGGPPEELRFAERFAQRPDGAIEILAVADPDQPVSTVLRFVGTTDASGVGGGAYSGTLVMS